MTQTKNVSDATALLIDEEIRKFVEEGESTARKIITEYSGQLEIIAQGLLEHETLSRDDIETLIAGGKIDRTDKSAPKPRDPGRRSSVPSSGVGGHRAPGFGQQPSTQTDG